MKRVISIASGGTIMALAFLLVAQYPSPGDARAEGNANSGRIGMIMEKPYFSISLEAYLCMGYLLLNGQLLYAPEMEHVKFDLPVMSAPTGSLIRSIEESQLF